MPTALRILILEDDLFDAELEIATLEEAGYECQWERVETRADYLARLDAPEYDLILADYSLPAFDGLTALKLFLECNLDLPFILISGTMGEETAIECIKAGATDYILKDRVSRLGPSVRRALREKEEQQQRRRAEKTAMDFNRILDDTLNEIYIFDAETLRFIRVNRWARRNLGYSMEELRNFTPVNLKPEFTIESFTKRLEPLRTGEKKQIVFTTIHRRKDGTLYPVEVYLQLSTLEDLSVFVAIILDITERKQLEEQLLQAQKMEAIGQLAGGVAHDFNNLLTVIGGYAELLLHRHLDEDSPFRWELEQIKKAEEKASMLTRQLLAFSRRQQLQPKILNLNEVVSDLEKILGRLIGEDINLNTVLDSTLAPIEADSGQLEQVIMNLVINARDAMPRGGQLTIETANIDLADPHFELVPGPYVVLTVTDTGIGMDAVTQARIFEPFFTTKSAGKGTGLGLSTVFGIIQQSGGHISISSEVNQGTTFKIYLPRIETTTTAAESSQVDVAAPTGSETILLVEDEASVRLVIREFLRNSGYTVIETVSGDEALLLCEQHQAPIHMLITDVVMPDMGGQELAKRIVHLRPEIRILYMSGYTDDIIDQHGVLEPGIALLQKPFTADTLARKVRQVLDGAQ